MAQCNNPTQATVMAIHNGQKVRIPVCSWCMIEGRILYNAVSAQPTENNKPVPCEVKI